jgi:hypothetical protein
VFGAFEPKTGQAFTTPAPVRDSQHFVAFLEQMVHPWPSGELFVILDNLSIHRTLDVRLWLLAHPHVQRDASRMTRCRTWSAASTRKGWRRWRHGMGVGRR